MTDFLKVEVRSNWGYWDRLDGQDFADGEEVVVRWPDRYKEAKRVSVERTVAPGSDMGHPLEVPTCRAYVTVRVHGAAVRLRLADADVLVRRT